MYRCRDRDGAVVMQQSSDETMEGTGLDHPGENKKERPKGNYSIIRWNENCRPGLDHSGQIKQQEPPPSQLDHRGTSGRPGAPDWIIRG